MRDNSKYAYIVGRLRAMESKMLNQNLLERLMDSKNAEEAYRVLADIPLISSSMGDYSVRDFDKVLMGALSEMKTLFIQMAPYPEDMNFLWLKYDFHNLKVVLKAQLTGRGYADITHALIDLGTVSMEKWEKHLLEGEPIELSPDIGKTIADVKEAYEKTPDPQIIDMAVDQHYLDVLKGIADRMDSPMITSYLKRLTDFANLRMFIRCKELKKDTAYLKSVLLSGGHVSSDVFSSLFERGYDDLYQAVSKCMYADDLASSLENFTETKSLIAAEKKVYELQQKFMSDSLKIAFGPEPVFAFFLRFENQLHIIRTVLIGKLNSLPAEEINHTVLAL